MASLTHRRRPVIGVTTPAEQGYLSYWATAYAIWREGGVARRIAPGEPVPMSQLQGLILGGGADVNPELYGQDVKAPCEEEQPKMGTRASVNDGVAGVLGLSMTGGLRAKSDKVRDEMELYMIEEALQEDVPILGVCRGVQILNVYHGGELHQDVSQAFGEQAEMWTALPKRPLRVRGGSVLELLTQRREMRVNSFHSQAVKTAGEGCVVVAKDCFGMVQSTEMPDRRFVLGVQWHPEYLPHRPDQRRIFEALVTCAKG